MCSTPVTFLTYKRAEYFRRTVRSFVELNAPFLDRMPMILLVQGGHNEETEAVIEEFKDYWHTVLRKDANKGCAWGYTRAMKEGMSLESKYVIHLQDDWESRESIGQYLDELINVMDKYEDIGMIRLRTQKERVFNKNRLTREGIEYRPVSEHILKSTAHYTLNPGFTRASMLKRLLPITREHDAMVRYHQLGYRSGQLKANCFAHIGMERALTMTEGGPRWIK